MKYIKYIFKVLDWVVFLVLGVLALKSVEESIAAYTDGKTSWAKEIHPIDSHPTLSMCFGLSNIDSIYQFPLIYGWDFYISVKTTSTRYYRQ